VEVITSDAGIMASEKVAFAVCLGVLESVTVTTTVKLPGPVGVPVIAPVDELIAIELGSPVADQVRGVVPPVAVSEAL